MTASSPSVQYSGSVRWNTSKKHPALLNPVTKTIRVIIYAYFRSENVFFIQIMKRILQMVTQIHIIVNG